MQPAAAPAAEVRFLALGDSYTIGESVAPADRWPNQLTAMLRARGIRVADPTIVARTGWTTDELSAGIDAAAPLGRFDLVTLLIGVNNQYRGRSLDEFRSEFKALLARAARFADGNPAHVVVVSIPDWSVTPFAGQDRRGRPEISAEVDRFNAVAREEASRARAHYVDVTPESRRAATEPSLTASDGLHPSAGMYSKWTTLVLPAAVDALSLSKLP